MRASALVPLLATLALLGRAESACAQSSRFLPVGTMAPDIVVEGATRYGLIADPVRLSDFRGNTVVLAFFFRVRGGG